MEPKKLFVVRKYVMARTAAEALRLEKRQGGHDVWIDDEWKKANSTESAGRAFGIQPPRCKPNRYRGKRRKAA